MQILNQLMKIKNAPAEGVRLISKTCCGPPRVRPRRPSVEPCHDSPGDSWQKRPLSLAVVLIVSTWQTSYGEISATMR